MVPSQLECAFSGLRFQACEGGRSLFIFAGAQIIPIDVLALLVPEGQFGESERSRLQPYPRYSQAGHSDDRAV
jgi:hypothetical protein